jgi:hypothetical protein
VTRIRQLFEQFFDLEEYNNMRKEKGEDAPMEDIGSKTWRELDVTHKAGLAYYFHQRGLLFQHT